MPESVPWVGFHVSLSWNLNVIVNGSGYVKVCTQLKVHFHPFIYVCMCSLGGKRQLGVN